MTREELLDQVHNKWMPGDNIQSRPKNCRSGQASPWSNHSGGVDPIDVAFNLNLQEYRIEPRFVEFVIKLPSPVNNLVFEKVFEKASERLGELGFNMDFVNALKNAKKVPKG